MVVVGAWHEYVGGTRGSGIVSSADDLLEMSVVCGMRGVRILRVDGRSRYLYIVLADTCTS